jgi:hypothetical protein
VGFGLESALQPEGVDGGRTLSPATPFFSENLGEDVETWAAAPTQGRNADRGPRRSSMKYMLMMFGDAEDMMEARSPEWVRDMIAFMTDFNTELAENGEFVEARGLDVPKAAKTVSLVDGQVVVTDGPFAETKEALAGYWVFEVAGEERAIELASKVVAWADRVELRFVPDGPPEV